MTQFFISSKECRVESNRSFYGCFHLGPFDSGQSLTIANSLRRTLLSELKGLAIISVEIEGALHEYSNLPGIRDSVLDILLNLKEIVLKGKKTSPRGHTPAFFPPWGPKKKKWIGDDPPQEADANCYADIVPPLVPDFTPVLRLHKVQPAYWGVWGNKGTPKVKSFPGGPGEGPGKPCGHPQIGYLKIRGPGIVKACDLKLPPFIQSVDPDQYIATLAEDGVLKMKFIITGGGQGEIGAGLARGEGFALRAAGGFGGEGIITHPPYRQSSSIGGFGLGKHPPQSVGEEKPSLEPPHNMTSVLSHGLPFFREAHDKGPLGGLRRAPTIAPRLILKKLFYLGPPNSLRHPWGPHGAPSFSKRQYPVGSNPSNLRGGAIEKGLMDLKTKQVFNKFSLFDRVFYSKLLKKIPPLKPFFAAIPPKGQPHRGPFSMGTGKTMYLDAVFNPINKVNYIIEESENKMVETAFKTSNGMAKLFTLINSSTLTLKKRNLYFRQNLIYKLLTLCSRLGGDATNLLRNNPLVSIFPPQEAKNATMALSPFTAKPNVPSFAGGPFTGGWTSCNNPCSPTARIADPPQRASKHNLSFFESLPSLAAIHQGPPSRKVVGLRPATDLHFLGPHGGASWGGNQIPNSKQLRPALRAPQQNIILEVWTNGSLHPHEAVYLAFKKLLELFLALKKVKITNKIYKSPQNYKTLINDY